MQTKTIEAATRAFAAIDFSEENAEIAAIEGRIADMQMASVTAEERCTAITRELVNFKGPSGADVSAALLAGHSATTAAVAGPSKDALETERTSLREGVKDLARQVEAARQQILGIRQAAHQRLNPICQMLVDELMEEARAAAERIMTVGASLEAISWTTKFGWYEAKQFKKAAHALTEGGAIIDYRRDIAVPAEICEALHALDGKGPAFPASFRTTVNM